MHRAGKWTLRLAVVAILAWYLRPLYVPPEAPLPASSAPGDSVAWRFYLVGHTNVLQQLTVFGDGRSTLVITRFENRDRTAVGPADLTATFDWTPSVWINRIRWQQVARLPRQFPSVYRRLQKQEVILVDDHGKPVETNPR